MDAARFKEQYLGFHQKLYRIAYRFLGNEEDASDVVQETYIKLWNKRKELEQIENSEAYAVTILRNMCLDQLKSMDSRSVGSLDEIEYKLEDSDQSSDNKLESSEQLGEVEKVIKTLPQQQQLVLKLRHWDDLSMEEIEKATGLSSVNVRVLLSRGRKKIKEILGVDRQ